MLIIWVYFFNASIQCQATITGMEERVILPLPNLPNPSSSQPQQLPQYRRGEAVKL
jgi:hypothetical protein